MRSALPRRRITLAGLMVGSVAVLAPFPAAAREEADSLAEGLPGRECLVMDYVGSYRSPLDSPIDRRPITTIVEKGSVHYVEASRMQLMLEGGTERSPDELTQLERLLDGRPDLRGFYPGEVAIVTSVKKKGEGVEIEVTDQGHESRGQRRGRIVLRFDGVAPDGETLSQAIWRLLLPKPPYQDADEELSAILAVVHGMELSRLAEWIGRTREETARLVAEAALDLGGLAEPERSALLHCYEQSYLALSDRSRIALVDVAVHPEADGGILEARAWPHLPLLGDWDSEAQRAKGAFAWSITKVVKSLARNCEIAGVEALEVTVRYDYRDSAGWGSDRLTSRVPMVVARAYAAIEIGTREMAGRSEHRLNGLPLSLGEW